MAERKIAKFIFLIIIIKKGRIHFSTCMLYLFEINASHFYHLCNLM